MRMRFLTALALLLSLLIELTFDNTNSFVRVAASHPESTPGVVYVPDPSSGHGDPGLNPPSTHSKSRNHPDVFWTLGHYACPASSFVHFVHLAINRLESRFDWHYRDIDRFNLLRPPIQA